MNVHITSSWPPPSPVHTHPLCLFLILTGLLQPALSPAAILGELEDPGKFDLSIASGWIDYTDDLGVRNFDVRLPAGYKADETYGLISFCSSGDNGGIGPTPWRPVLDKYRLIWAAGDNIGNAKGTNLRRGAVILGAMRMTELHKIAPERIYASGNSGGSRMAAGVVLMRDDFFTGCIGDVGAAATELLPDDFLRVRNRGDEAGYEYNASGDSITSARFAYQTFYNELNPDREGDFREQEIMTCYHLFMVPNGNAAKLVDSPGTHTTKLEYAFEEAVKFMVHPLYPVMEDAFGNGNLGGNPGSGNGFAVVAGNAGEQTIPNSTTGTSGVLVLDPGSKVRSHDVFDWNNDFGMNLQAAYRSSFAGSHNQRIRLSLMAADLRQDIRMELTLEQVTATEKHVSLVMSLPGGREITLCSFALDANDEPMTRGDSDRAYYKAGQYDGPGYLFRGSDLIWSVDDDKFQLSFRQDIDRSTFTSALLKPTVLLTDRWTVQGRWSDMGLAGIIEDLKEVGQWRIEIGNEAIDKNAAADEAWFDFLNIASAEPGSVAALDGSESMATTRVQDSGPDGLLVLEAEAYHRQEVQGLHHWIQSTQQSGYSGTGTVTTARNYQTRYTADNFAGWAARLEYDLEFTRTGSHKIWIRGYAGTASDDACWAGFNADGTDAVDISGFGTGAYSWVSRAIEVGETGRKRLYLWIGEDGLEVDQILITSNPAYTPRGTQAPTAGTVLPLSEKPISNMTYSAWAATFDAVIGSPDDDYDADGQSNFAEFVLNGDPTDSIDSGIAPYLSMSGGKLVLSYPRRNDAVGLSYALQASTDLTADSWQAYPGASPEVIPLNDAFDLVSDPIPTPTGNLFFQLQVGDR